MNWIEFVTTALVVWNALVFLTYGLDKRRAKQNRRRISEKILLLSAALLGGPGALLGMYAFRHKTKHTKFKVGVPLLLVLNVILAIILYRYL